MKGDRCRGSGVTDPVAGRMEPEEQPVDFIQPVSWADALAAKAAMPTALPVAGGTDVMVELNFDARRPEALLDLTRITELTDWDTGTDAHIHAGTGTHAGTATHAGTHADAGTGTHPGTGTHAGSGNGRIRLGAAVTYSQVIDELGEQLPGLAMAARTVGSPQIRNRGTVGGNLGAASPAGDC